MCQLFALSSDRPTNATFSLGVFGERGGRMGPHKDGWGIAFKEGRDFRLIKEPTPAADSACLSFLEAHEFRSEIVLSHIRLASVPRVDSYTNTHPFARELYGACHVFAHNGDMPDILRNIVFAPTWNFPLGQTDRAAGRRLNRRMASLTSFMTSGAVSTSVSSRSNVTKANDFMCADPSIG